MNTLNNLGIDESKKLIYLTNPKNKKDNSGDLMYNRNINVVCNNRQNKIYISGNVIRKFKEIKSSVNSNSKNLNNEDINEKTKNNTLIFCDKKIYINYL